MKKFLPFGLILGISLILILIWFKDGRIFAGGDVGFQTYNPQRILESARFIWWDASAPGTVMPQGLTAVPLQFGLSLLQSLGLPPVAIQASLFLVLLFLMGTGMYLYLTEKLKEEGRFLPLAGALFYMFNPYMFVQVWHRFVHTAMILAAALPFFAFVWERWIKKGSIKSLFFFLLANLAAVYIYGTYAYIVTVWIFLFFITIASLVPWQGKKAFVCVAGKFLAGFILWLLINAWWMIPSAKISPALLSEQHKSAESVINLIMISGQAILPYSISLLNPFYLFYQAEFGSIYKNPLFAAIPLIFTGVILLGLIRSFKTRVFSLFGILFLLALFLAKGAAPPLGSLYIYGFKNFFALGILRNPFEKTGLILVFFASVLFVLGLGKFKNKLVPLAVLVSVLIFSWPMLGGKVFGRIDKKGDVEVPSGYKEADSWLKEKRNEGIKDGNILHLPLTRGESVRYNWQYGYNGLESSNLFFTSHSSISRGFNVQRVDDALTALSMIFRSGEKDKILKLLQDFNVRFIVLHKDLNWFASDVYNPLEAEETLNQLEFLEKKKDFGSLALYQINDDSFRPVIEISQNPTLIYPANATMGVWPWLAQNSANLFISPSAGEKDERITNSKSETIVFAQNAFTYPQASASGLPQTVNELSSALGNLSSTAGYLKQLGIIEPSLEKLLNDITLASDKLARGAYAEYAILINNIISKIGDPSIMYIERIKDAAVDVLKLHEVILSATGQSPQAKESLRQMLAKEKLLPAFWPQSNTVGFERQYFDFNIFSKGSYELLLSDSGSSLNYADNLNKIEFLINGQTKQKQGQVWGKYISYGLIDLNEGFNQISISAPNGVNLAPTLGLFTLAANPSGPQAANLPLNNMTGNDVYEVSFEAQISPGATLFMQILQDSDEEQNGSKVPRISVQARGETGGWQTFKVKLPPVSPVTREGVFRLAAVSGSASIKDLKLIRVLNNKIFLRKSAAGQSWQSANNVSFEKVSTVLYKGKLSLKNGAFFFFKQTFHPGWKLTLKNENETFAPQARYLGNLYGDAWYIERGGNYDFTLFFEPQKYFNFGIILTALGFAGLGGYALLRKKRKI